MESVETQIVPVEFHFSWQDDNPAFGGGDDNDCDSDYDDGMDEFDYNDIDSFGNMEELKEWLTRYDELIGLPPGIYDELMGRVITSDNKIISD